MARFRIRTNWTNSVSATHEFALDDLSKAAVRDKLKWAMSDPERLRPGESRQVLTERAATTFASLAQSLRDSGHEPQTVAHFVNRLVFCMFAEDVDLLPDNMFTRMLEHARRRPDDFVALARDLFGAMSTGGRIGFEAVSWFNGGLFDDDTALPLAKSEIETTLRAAALDCDRLPRQPHGLLPASLDFAPGVRRRVLGGSLSQTERSPAQFVGRAVGLPEGVIDGQDEARPTRDAGGGCGSH